LHKEVARASVADSAIITEVESCIATLRNMLKGGCISVLTMKIPIPAGLGMT
jgi:hypothetical protein